SQRSEWDVLKQHHRFVREDEEAADVSWEERLARAYESKLFKEYALIDLKHFKSKRFALRWRTATEVVEGLGEETCGSLRCAHHPSGSEAVDLKAFELPFVYVEDGERKEALVKVRLCTKCAKKLTWKPEEERERGRKRSMSPRRESHRDRGEQKSRRDRDHERTSGRRD
ncbi:hypothetical protein CC85DRAFT_234058, partial [Cutaneotrichosporon oleaginosum]